MLAVAGQKLRPLVHHILVIIIISERVALVAVIPVVTPAGVDDFLPKQSWVDGHVVGAGEIASSETAPSLTARPISRMTTIVFSAKAYSPTGAAVPRPRHSILRTPRLVVSMFMAAVAMVVGMSMSVSMSMTVITVLAMAVAAEYKKAEHVGCETPGSHGKNEPRVPELGRLDEARDGLEEDGHAESD
jgi:hypothetical protein